MAARPATEKPEVAVGGKAKVRVLAKEGVKTRGRGKGKGKAKVKARGRARRAARRREKTLQKRLLPTTKPATLMTTTIKSMLAMTRTPRREMPGVMTTPQW